MLPMLFRHTTINTAFVLKTVRAFSMLGLI